MQKAFEQTLHVAFIYLFLIKIKLTVNEKYQ